MGERNESSLWQRIVAKVRGHTPQENQQARPPLTEKEFNTLPSDQREILELLANAEGPDVEGTPRVTEEDIQREFGTHRSQSLAKETRKALQDLHRQGLVRRTVEHGISYWAVRPEDVEAINADEDRFQEGLMEKFVEQEMRKRNQLN